jgi:hypothetical protein
MIDTEKRAPAWISAVTIAAPVLSAAFVAYLTHSTNIQVAELEESAKSRQVAVEQARLREEQDRRRQQFLVDHVPKLLSAKAEERSLGRALLFLAFPNEAAEIVQQVIPASSDTTRQWLLDASREAAQVQAQTGAWTVIVSGDRALDPARYEVERATKLHYKPVSLILRDGVYRTAVGNYPTRQVAEQAALALRSQIRPDAYVVALGRWCPAPAVRNEAGTPVIVCESAK